MNRIKLLILTAIFALTAVSCGNKESSDVPVSQSESAAADSKQEEASKPAEDAPVYDPGLVTLAQEMYDAKVIEGDDIATLFEAEYEKKGAMALCADIKTADIFDPIDDMMIGIAALSDVKPNAQIMMLTQFTEIKDGMMADGLLMVAAFGCKDEAEARSIFPYVFTESMKDDLDHETEEDPDYLKYTISEDGGMILMSFGDEEFMAYFGYYIVDNNVYVIGVYDTEFTETPVNGEYKPTYDYMDEMKKLCEKLGVSSPAELRE